MFIKNINRNMSFGTYYNTEYKNNRKDIKYRNDTMLFRYDINWQTLIDHITEKDIPLKIYCYACSDGSEPYSLAIALISKLGYEKAKQYFPIIAKDIDKNVITKAKKRNIQLETTDLNKLKRYQDQTHLKYIEPVKKTDLRYMNCKVNSILSNNIIFEQGDILEDIDLLNMDNSVLIFRNAWPYLPKDSEFYLMSKLSEKFKENSSLVIGEYDKNRIIDKLIHRNMLNDYGFEEVKPLIFKKRKKVL